MIFRKEKKEANGNKVAELEKVRIEEENSLKEEEKMAATKANDSISNIISEHMKIKGDLTFKGKIRVDGRIDGNLEGDYVILGEKAVINGDMVVETCVCFGEINGNVKAEKVILRSTSVFKGKIEASDLSVESGAIIEGEIFIGKPESKASASQQPSVSILTASNEAPEEEKKAQ